MTFKPSEITREHVLKSIEVIKKSNQLLTDGTKWEVVIDGKGYPPKEVMRFAREQYDGSNQWPKGGGWPTNEFLEKMGFEVREIKNSLEGKLQPYIEKYKVLISTSKLYSEIYKWELLTNFKNNWNLDSTNLNEMLDKAFPGNQNLWSSNQYYPIAMLKGFADTNPKGVVEAISNLLDEKSEQSLRITQYRNAMDALLKEDNQKRNLNSKMHYQDGRTIGLLLAFYNPKKHYLFKFNILKSFCEKFGLKAPKKGDVVNQIKINDEISNQVRSILLEDDELLSIHNERLTNKSFKEDDYHLLTQDFIYSTVTYLKDNMKYYVGGAYWYDNNPQDQTERFLRESIWQNGYEDKFNVIVDSIPEGSLFALKTTDKKGNKMHIKAIGRVVLNHKNGQTLDIEWQVGFTPFIVDFAGGYWETVKEVTNSDHINEIFFHTNETVIMDNKELKLNTPKSINQILYGPPGTGKTYKLQQIIEEWDLKKKTSSTEDYSEFVKDYTWWKIIALALLDLEKVTVPELAKHPLIIAKLGSSNIKSLKTRLWSSLQHHCVDDCVNVKLAKRIGEKIFYKEVNSEWRLDSSVAFQLEFMPLVDAYEEFKTSENIKSKDYTFTTCHQSLTYEDFIEGIKPDLNKKNDDDEQSNEVVYEIRKGIFYNACEKAVQKAGFINLKDCLDKTKEERKELFDKAIEEGKIHVIFLDEINRCNVSSVFGELITLIEEDKRLGKENEIADITLPYSQDDFGVPPNLYIIGTMNTADRSVEALDTALRRRFSFEEMSPKYDLKELQGQVYGFVLYEILATLNKRIVRLLNNDHAIGHSYFLKKNEDTIIESFYKNIIPLLQEYFFGDYGKMMLVLGDGFVTYNEWKDEQKFFASYNDSKNDYDVKDLYFIQDYSNNKQGFAEALKKLMNK